MTTYKHYKNQVVKQEEKVEILRESLKDSEGVGDKHLSKLNDQLTRAEKSLQDKRDRLDKYRNTLFPEVSGLISSVKRLENSVDEPWITEARRLGPEIRELRKSTEVALEYLTKFEKLLTKTYNEFGSEVPEEFESDIKKVIPSFGDYVRKSF